MRTALFAAIVCFTTSVMHAGIVYRTSDHRVVSIDGARYRVESETFPEPHAYDTVISTDGGATKTYLNRTLRTWYESKPDDPVPVSGRFRVAHDPELDKNPKVEAHDEPTDESVAGHPTEKHVIRIAYRMKEHFGRDTVRSNVAATVVVWTTPDFPRGPLPFDVRTSWPELDRQLDAIAATFRGLIVREVSTVGFWYDGGKPFNDAHSWAIDEIAVRDVPPATFRVPAEYAHQFPVIGAPGAVSH